MGEFVIKNEIDNKRKQFPRKVMPIRVFFSDFKFYLSAIFGKLELFSAFL